MVGVCGAGDVGRVAHWAGVVDACDGDDEEDDSGSVATKGVVDVVVGLVKEPPMAEAAKPPLLAPGVMEW